ncbi:hypothetical protein BJX99DRAFT_265683 [Aspergillus californicus]
MPVCTRCQASNTECHYIRSRRGLRKSTKNEPSQSLEADISLLAADDFAGWLDTALPAELDLENGFSLFHTASLTESDPATPDVAYDPMVQLYYQNFHPSHPITIPRKALNSSLSYLIPPYLLSIMRYIGAHFYPNPSVKQSLRPAAYSFLSDPSLRDGFKVQGLLLLAIVDHSNGHEQSAQRLIHTAVNLALEIGMHEACFARAHSFDHSILEESWCRTYWELYIVDGLLSAMREQSPFRLFHQPVSVQLPCCERMYNLDNAIPTNQTLPDFQSGWTLGHDFSSFAHRINAVQNLGEVLEINRSLEHNESRVETIDAHITSSLMALPSLHGDGYDSANHDEMVFQAQMTLYLALIYLHHPLSSLRFASFQTTPSTSCRLKATGDSELSIACGHSLDIHSHKLIRAADLLSGLATLPSSIRSRSPFFTCALGICIVVHTAALLVVNGSGKKESVKARIQLGIAALKALGKVWPLARNVRGQMVDMYREVVG